MAHKNGLICLDWDGTIVNSAPGIVSRVVFALNELSHPVPSETIIRSMIGEGRDVIAKYHFGGDMEKAQKFWYIFQKAYLELDTPEMMPGAFDFLKNHQDFHIAITTNKKTDFLKKEINHHNVDQYIDYTYTVDDYPAKPDPNMILAALSDSHCEAQQSYLIGDSQADKDAADRSGVEFIGVFCSSWHSSSLEFNDIIIKKEN